MRTVTIDAATDLDKLVDDAVRCLRNGEIILIPTETQYGLCCHAENGKSVEQLLETKGRDHLSPMALLVANWKQAESLATRIPEKVDSLVSEFWPGPLTIIASAIRSDWSGVVSVDGKIGFRCSSHPLASRLAISADFTIAQTSANKHGESPSSDPDYLTNWLADTVGLLIFDRSVTTGDLPSTVVDVSDGKLRILRHGAVDPSVIHEVWKKEINK